MNKLNQKLQIKGIKRGDYLTLKVRTPYGLKNGGGEIVANPGDIYYYHLQHPTIGEAMAHISARLHAGEQVLGISTTQSTPQHYDFCLPQYITPKQISTRAYTAIWHYKIFKKLGINWR